MAEVTKKMNKRGDRDGVSRAEMGRYGMAKARSTTTGRRRSRDDGRVESGNGAELETGHGFTSVVTVKMMMATCHPRVQTREG